MRQEWYRLSSRLTRSSAGRGRNGSSRSLTHIICQPPPHYENCIIVIIAPHITMIVIIAPHITIIVVTAPYITIIVIAAPHITIVVIVAPHTPILLCSSAGRGRNGSSRSLTHIICSNTPRYLCCSPRPARICPHQGGDRTT